MAVAEKPAATVEEAFNFASYMKERAQMVNEALDKSVPLQYPEIINESMRQAYLTCSLLICATKAFKLSMSLRWNEKPCIHVKPYT